MSPRATRPIPIGSTFGTIFPARAGRGWRAVVEVKPPEGKRFQVARSGASFDDARSALQSVIAAAAVHSKRAWTMAQLVEAWDAFHRGDHSTLQESSRRHYSDTWRLHIAEFVPTGSRLPLKDREPSSITREELWDCIHADSGRSKYVKDAIRSILRFALNRGVVSADVSVGGFQIKSSPPQPKPIDQRTMEVIETHLASLQARGRRKDPLLLHDVWVLMRATGARIGEALALQVGDIDWVTGHLKLAERHIAKVETEAGTVTDGIKPGGKTRSATRTVVVSPRVLQLDLRRRCAAVPSVDTPDWHPRDPEDWVFRTDQGNFVTPSSFRSRLNRELSSLDLGRKVTPHDLRDTAATAIVQELTTKYGLHEGLREAAAMLGHGGIGPALLPYVDKSATVVDHAPILDGLDPRAVRESAIREKASSVARRYTFSKVTEINGALAIAALADDVEAAREDVLALGLAVAVIELDPFEVEF